MNNSVASHREFFLRCAAKAHQKESGYAAKNNFGVRTVPKIARIIPEKIEQ